MVGKGLHYQDILLNHVRKEGIPVTIFLTNGYQLKGLIKAFDNYVILMDSDGKQQMIYKHAISTIAPSRPVRFPIGQKTQAEQEELQGEPQTEKGMDTKGKEEL